jgi:hypothetical protein
MRKLLFIGAFILLFVPLAFAANEIIVPSSETAGEITYVPNQFVIKLKPEANSHLPVASKIIANTGIRSLDELGNKFGVTSIEEEFPGAANMPGGEELARYRIVAYSGPQSLEEVVGSYAADRNIEVAEPITIHPMYDVVPNDYYFAGQADPWNQWGMALTAPELSRP